MHKEFTKGERRVVALEEIDLDVAEREFVAILGPSGCGKSTLLNMVAGFDLPTRGSVKVAGEEIVAPAPSRGVVFQEPALFPWLTVMDNVVFGPKTGVRTADYRARAAQIIERSACRASKQATRPSSPAACDSAWASRACYHGAEGAADGRAVRQPRRADALMQEACSRSGSGTTRRCSSSPTTSRRPCYSPTASA